LAKWSNEQEQELIKLRKEGLYIEELAKITGRSRSSISRKIQAMIEVGRLAPINRGGNRKGEKPREKKKVEITEESLGVLCKYPGCTHDASKRFAQVPLCSKHFHKISNEVQTYYRANRERPRPHFDKIAMLIPWSRKRMGKE
jgi:hypothetical protein